jgi:tRNA 2-thiouridine synthesizing protein A
MIDNVAWFGRRQRAQQPLTAIQEEEVALPHAALTIDALGRKCPIPIIMAAEQIRDVPVGDTIALLADDPAAYADVPSWCGMKSHELVHRSEYATGWVFIIRRNY